MRLEKKQQAELAKREGQARRTIIQIVWLAISIGVAYLITEFLIFAPENGLLTYTQVYRALSISTRDIPQWGITAVFIFLIVVVMQFIFFIGFFFASYEGRRRPGDPSLYSREKDPLDQYYD